MNSSTQIRTKAMLTFPTPNQATDLAGRLHLHPHYIQTRTVPVIVLSPVVAPATPLRVLPVAVPVAYRSETNFSLSHTSVAIAVPPLYIPLARVPIPTLGGRGGSVCSTGYFS